MNPIALIFGRRGGPPGLARARGNSRAHGNYATPKIDVRAAVFDRNARILLVRETADGGRRTLLGGSSGCKLPMPFMIRARALLPPFGACRVPSGPLNGRASTAFAAIASTLPRGSETDVRSRRQGAYHLTLDRHVLDRLKIRRS
jgi:hypothetical protein